MYQFAEVEWKRLAAPWSAKIVTNDNLLLQRLQAERDVYTAPGQVWHIAH
jgi:hypothetical protein